MTRTVVLAGASGHGRTHLAEIAALEAAGLVRLAGVCDVRPLDPQALALVGDRPFDTDLGRLLDSTVRTSASSPRPSTPISRWPGRCWPPVRTCWWRSRRCPPRTTGANSCGSPGRRAWWPRPASRASARTPSSGSPS
ncbi:hypothetical protein SBRY_120037 [Actinacidiphila bryophytorum]|uniref:Uncharacterized protein n=1 Tax=Actinacidiphila bryophytorum TaxID=1436133 RepID=A0A9W4GYV0_9ACTN|nr:hypothetical protein SBRY_120037 [Actinacidiphila bryophytorum]